MVFNALKETLFVYNDKDNNLHFIIKILKNKVFVSYSFDKNTSIVTFCLYFNI